MRLDVPRALCDVQQRNCAVSRKVRLISLLFRCGNRCDAIKAFAGPDYEKAVYYPEDSNYLLALDPRVSHHKSWRNPNINTAPQPQELSC